jgi:hypothetical protein
MLPFPHNISVFKIGFVRDLNVERRVDYPIKWVELAIPGEIRVL